MKKTIQLLLVGFVLFCVQARAQGDSGFEAFIKKLGQASVSTRHSLVESYLSKTKSTPIIEGTQKVHFVWYGKADTLMIEGDLQKAWSTPEILSKIECGESDFFHISYPVPADALLEYRFIADKKRLIDLRNPKITKGFDFREKNYFMMPGLVEPASLGSRLNIEKGNINQWVFKTKHPSFTNRLIWIYTPYGYSKTRQYPVLYVLDGSSISSRPFINVLDNLIYDKKIEPVVVVFVSFIERWNEYVEQSTEYAKLLTDEMLPFIESNFQVSKLADKRGIIGVSASGHGAIVTALRHPDVFGNVASQGGGAGGSPGLNPLANQALDYYLTLKDKYPLRRLYTEIGTFDLQFPADKIVFRDGVLQFRNRLLENKIDHVFREVNGGHNDACWNLNLENILILFYGL